MKLGIIERCPCFNISVKVNKTPYFLMDVELFEKFKNHYLCKNPCIFMYLNIKMAKQMVQ